MNFCTKHWQALRAEIVSLGMEPLIATSGEQAAAQMAASLEKGPSKETFDPLMAASMEIFNRALDRLGVALMLADESGKPPCPLCALQAVHEARCKEPGCTWTFEANWIPGAARQMLEHAKSLGLVAAA